MRTLIVDGYNVIHAWPGLKQALQEGGLEHARARLLHTLSEYAAQAGLMVTVVFDAHGRRGGTEGVVVDGVTVYYGTSTASADHVIERLAYTAARDGGAADVTVATSDRLQRSMVTAMGVATLSAPALEEEVSRVLAGTEQASRRMRDTAQRSARLSDRLDPRTRQRLEALRRGEPDPAEPAADAEQEGR